MTAMSCLTHGEHSMKKQGRRDDTFAFDLQSIGLDHDKLIAMPTRQLNQHLKKEGKARGHYMQLT